MTLRPTQPVPAVWPGCHGVLLHSGFDLGLGHHEADAGDALATVEVGVGPVEPGSGPGTELWSVPAPGSTGGRPGPSAMRAHRAGDDGVIVDVGDERRLRYSPSQSLITTSPPFDPIQSQLVAAFGLPLVLERLPAVLVLHAAAAAKDERAVLIAGPGGTGKSSALIALMAHGWAPISEDVCVVDLSGPAARIWPGPPWVRVGHEQPGPRGAAVRFRTTEKTAWDLGVAQRRGPAQVSLVVCLDPPGGAEPELRRLHPPEAVAALAAHAVWLDDQEERARALFGPVATAARRLPVARLRLPVDPEWADQLVTRLDPDGDGPTVPPLDR